MFCRASGGRFRRLERVRDYRGSCRVHHEVLIDGKGRSWTLGPREDEMEVLGHPEDCVKEGGVNGMSSQTVLSRRGFGNAGGKG